MNLLYNEYYGYLEKILKTHIIITVAVSLLVIIPLIWSFVKKEPTGVKIIFVTFFLVVIIAGIVGIVPYYLDISQEAILTYSGEYYVDEIIDKSPGIYATFVLSDGTCVEYDMSYCDNVPKDQQSYNGTLIYSKYSSILFYLE